MQEKINTVVVYRDVDQTLSNNYVDDVEDIMQSVVNILTTTPGELLFNAQFGSYLKRMLFELSTPAFELEVLSEITRAVGLYEPRIKLNFSKSKVDIDDETNTVWVTFIFSIVGLNIEDVSQEVGFKKYESN